MIFNVYYLQVSTFPLGKYLLWLNKENKLTSPTQTGSTRGIRGQALLQGQDPHEEGALVVCHSLLSITQAKLPPNFITMKMQVIFWMVLLLIPLAAWAQHKGDTQIRHLEQAEITAVHRGDTLTLLKLWDKAFVVNNPYGEIVTVPQIMGFIRAGKIDYSTVERVVERITFSNNIAIAMGKEIVTPQNGTENAGKTVIRRYTHTWLKTGQGWRLLARQATNFSVQ